ncbi:MAG: hypothetical protein MUF04_15030, partial [Akkermansiaceae bacterium]|nr:hypothetical protein [Akkermansiaceae bacterium]
FGSPDDRPLVAGRLQVAGDLPPVALGFTPSPGTCLTLVDMTGSEPLAGTFANLAQGQIVELDHAGGTYRFVADYRGGNGNDLVLRWHNSRILAWGSNSYGQLGNNSNADSRTPVPTAMGGILAGKAVVQLGRGVGSYGNTFSLALCADGTLAAWGSSSAGALGAGSTTQSKVPLAVDQTGVLAGRRVVQIATGADSVLALCDDGTLVSWGHDGSGQLGNDSKNESRSTPVLVDRSGVLAGKTVVQVAAGNSHCLALCSDGSVAAWGNNSNGQLGNGYTYNSPLPVLTNLGAVPPDQRVVAVAAGHSHSLALCSDGALLAWGENRYGQLGVQTSGGSNTPVPVDRSGVLAGRTLVALAAGEYSTLVLATDGSMFAWGANWNGNLGNGTTTSSSVPVEVSRDGSLAGKTVKSVAVSGRNSFALASDGSLYAWGASALLGGATADSWVPAAFPTAALRADEVFMRMAPGGTDGHALAITALPLPTAATLAASQITGYRALVQGAVNARDNTTTVRFEYGLNESYGTTISATPDNLAGNAETVAGATLRGLLPTTTYHFRVVAECAGGVIRGEDRTFTTGPAGAPPVFSGYSAAAPYQTPATIGLRKLLSKASDMAAPWPCWRTQSTTRRPTTSLVRIPSASS